MINNNVIYVGDYTYVHYTYVIDEVIATKKHSRGRDGEQSWVLEAVSRSTIREALSDKVRCELRSGGNEGVCHAQVWKKVLSEQSTKHLESLKNTKGHCIWH